MDFSYSFTNLFAAYDALPEVTKRKIEGLNVAWEIVGMHEEEGRALIRELREFAIQSRFVYRHKCRVGDAILWDNRSTMHCATPFDEERYRRVCTARPSPATSRSDPRAGTSLARAVGV